MTFGEKLKQARLNAKMSQEELALKVSVSRSAITKWETDRGLPDVQNLKAIAYALDISLDYLLEDGTKLDLSVVREAIDLSQYGKGRKKVIKDKIVREKYPDADIMTLLAEEKLTKAENIMDWAVFLLTPLINVFPIAKGLNNLDKEFYLVNQGQRQYLVVVTNEFMESRELGERVTQKKFEVGNFKFINAGPIRYA
ncbi:MAG: helix-turn-helix domain-containing protein [Christensenellales bacterium]|jgi:transcriptional regulator with XRE-family HTH domain